MRTFPLVLITSALIAPPFLTGPVQAADPAELSVVVSGNGMGNMWFAVKIPAGTHHLTIDWLANQTAGWFVSGWSYLYDEQGDLIDYYGLAAAPTDDTFVHTQGDGLPYLHQDLFDTGGHASGHTTLGCPSCPATNQTFTYVVVNTKAYGSWNFTVRTNDWPNLSAEWDNTAFLYRSRDFNGTLDAQVSPDILVRANVNTSLTIHSNDKLVGFYKTSGGHVDPVRAMSIDTPHGPETCPCSFFEHASGPDAWGPGDYTFHLTDVDYDTEVVVFGASIRLPP